jgi:hypothetical protein
MPRVVWPNAFVLHVAALPEVRETEGYKRVVHGILPEVMEQPPHPEELGAPVALRWSTSPVFGFPRRPFNVFRRFRRYVTDDLGKDPREIKGTRLIEWGLREMYEVSFSANPTPGATLTVEALDRGYQVIPGQRIVFSSSGRGRLRSPGIAALRVSGQGTIGAIVGVDQARLANMSGWDLIEVVGLPYDTGETGLPVYDPLPQGFVPPSRSGVDAALIRLTIAGLLHQPPPATGVPDIPTPAWPSPDPGAYLRTLRDPDPSPLRMIDACLRSTNDNDPARLQADFRYESVRSGIRQADLPGATPGNDPTVMHLPVVGVTLLAVGSDSDAATGLGYGTIDFPPLVQRDEPPVLEPPGTVQTDWDYMVTNEFVLPFFGPIEIAALAQARPAPSAPAGLTAAHLSTNRPPARDAAGSEAVQLQWNLAPLPQGYGVAVSRRPFDVQVLNAPRPIAGGFDPFIPLRPPSAEGSPPAGVRTTFVDPVAPLPLAGSQTSRYLVAGLDVFGRWSGWRQVAYTASAPPVIAPGLHAVAFAPTAVGTMPDRLEIEFAWDWSDRTPDRIEFVGRFIAPNATSIPTFTANFALAPVGPLSPTVVVRFDASERPLLASPHTGSVEQILFNPPNPDPDPERRKYRLTIHGVSCDFSTVAENAYAVYARATEHVRPTERSAPVGPRVGRVADPRPPTTPALPIDLQWTALPDATGRARAVLRWPSVPGAVGYNVWEATEAAIIQAIDPTRPPAPPGTSLLSRAATLRTLIGASPQAQARSLQAFARLNTEPLTGTSIELDLPGNADTIFAFRISSVSAANVESERSPTVALFGVPRRNQPGQPRLLLRTLKPTSAAPNGAIKVIAIPGAGVPPVGYRVYRVQNPALIGDLGMKGPPKIAHDDPGWRSEPVDTRDGPVTASVIEDRPPPSWYPYHYQIVALGADNPPAGEYRGESIPSSVQPAFLPPVDPPLLELIGSAGNTTNRVITFRTDLPVRPTSLGGAAIEVLQIAPAADGRRIERIRLLAVAAHEVAEGAPLAPLPAPTADELAAMPELNRGAVDAAGRAVYTLRLRAEVARGAIVVRDPLGRAVELAFEEAS